MKKLLLTALAALSITAQAQNFEHVTDVAGSGSNLRLLPMDFTIDDQTKLIAYDNGYWGAKTAQIYDMNMNVMASIKLLDMVTFSYYDEGVCEEYVGITQTLFDDDDSYEYISQKEDRLQLIKDDGTIITTFDFGDRKFSGSEYIAVFHTHAYRQDKERWFLAFDLCDKDGENLVVRFYSFEKGKIASTIKQVKDVCHNIKATPSLPKANELVKVDLGDMKSPHTLSMINANGSVVSRMKLKEGQKEASVSTQGLPAGMYIIRVSDGKTETDNCKIIIR